ncbi:MAG: histidine phosphatase family protein [Gemmataceae bacterium]
MNPSLPKLYLARHGQTEWSLTGQHTGRTDIALTPVGEEEARRLGERLRDFTVANVFTSPLQRASKTCEIAGYGDHAIAEDALMEWHYGDYEGKRITEIRELDSDWLLFRDGAPNGETPNQVQARVDRFIQRVRSLEGDSLAFAHGHILRIVATRWIGLPIASSSIFTIDTATLSILGYEHNLDEPVIRVWNS